MSNINHNFNIATMFAPLGGTKPHNGKLDINTLFRNYSTTQTHELDTQILIDAINRRKNKIKECYEGFYGLCIKTITDASELGLTDTFFEIPLMCASCIFYNSYDCLNYIKEKLNKLKIEVEIIFPTKIIINWINIEK